MKKRPVRQMALPRRPGDVHLAGTLLDAPLVTPFCFAVAPRWLPRHATALPQSATACHAYTPLRALGATAPAMPVPFPHPLAASPAVTTSCCTPATALACINNLRQQSASRPRNLC